MPPLHALRTPGQKVVSKVDTVSPYDQRIDQVLALLRLAHSMKDSFLLHPEKAMHSQALAPMFLTPLTVIYYWHI